MIHVESFDALKSTCQSCASCAEICEMLFSLYLTPVFAAGFPYDVLAEGHWVPGTERTKFKGKELWEQVMTVTEKSCLMYFRRVCDGFNKACPPHASAKAKARMV